MAHLRTQPILIPAILVAAFVFVPARVLARRQSAPGSRPAQVDAPGSDEEIPAGSAIKRVEPEYPEPAIRTRIEGRVVIRVGVDEHGNVLSAVPVSGPVELRDAAVKAARRWKFSPVNHEGHEGKSTGLIVFSFVLTDAKPGHSQSAWNRGETVSAYSPVAALSDREKRRLLRQLRSVPDRPLAVKTGGLPVEILSAGLRLVLRDSSTHPHEQGLAVPADNYFTLVHITLSNRSDQRIAEVGIRFRNAETNSVFYVYPATFTMGGHSERKLEISLMSLIEDPSHLEISVAGALLADATIWGDYPFPPRPDVETRFAHTAASSYYSAVPLSRPEPTYTDEARRHQILGTVKLEVQVSIDGRVKGIRRVLNPLPDGLTAEAIRTARGLQFKPAMKNGSPIDDMVVLDVDFGIK
ncbi:MAG TPA: energy transducer TonB [Blastocatellia bacterium]|nr:energy transducer TonB [Blastocatellia bacterium]